MVEKLDSLSVQGEVPQVLWTTNHKCVTYRPHPSTSPKCTCTNPPHNYLIIEEVNGVSIELEGECLKEGYIVGQNLLI